jgi:hypothetical protein
MQRREVCQIITDSWKEYTAFIFWVEITLKNCKQCTRLYTITSQKMIIFIIATWEPQILYIMVCTHSDLFYKNMRDVAGITEMVQDFFWHL